MPKKNILTAVGAAGDTLIGAGALVFFTLGPSFLPHLKALPLFSTEFFISLALPAFVLISGIGYFIRMLRNPVITYFISFIVGIYSLTALFSPDTPFFLDASAPASLVGFFRYAVPIAAIAYFAARSLIAFLASKKDKGEERAPGGGVPFAPREFFCAACRAPLKTTDVSCPSCGALIRGWRCPECGVEGAGDEPPDGRCPRCGREPKSENEKINL